MRKRIQNPHLDREWFLTELEKRKMSVRALGKHLGVSSTMASLMMRGVAKIPHDQAVKLADLFGVQTAEIYKRAGATLNDEKRVLIMSHYFDKDFHVLPLPSENQFNIDAPYDTPSTAFGIQMRTGDLYDNWILITSGIRLKPEEAANKLCVYDNADGNTYIAIIRPGYAPGTYNAVSALATGVTVENIEILKAMEINWIRPRST